MPKYAQIINNKVHWIGNYDNQPNFNSNVGTFDNIENNKQGVKEGWNCIDGIYSASIAPPKQSIFALWVFMKRFTAAERIALRSSTNATVQSILKDFECCREIDLDDQDIKDGMDTLVSLVTELTTSRRNTIMGVS